MKTLWFRDIYMGINNRKRRGQKKQIKDQKRKEKKGCRNKNNESIGPVFKVMHNPFAGLSDDVRKKIQQKLIDDSEETYQDSLTQIKELLVSYEPLILLSVLASYGLTVNVGDDGIKTKDSEMTIHQAHLEICQALTLQISKDKLGRMPFGPDVVKKMWEALKEHVTAHSFRGLKVKNEEITKEEDAVESLQQWVRGNRLMVRNWGYFSQVKNISREIYNHFDDLVEKHYGFSVENVIGLFEILLDEVESRNSNRFKILTELFQIKNKNDLVYKYYNLIGQSKYDADEFIKSIDFKSIPRKNLFGMMLSHYDMRLPDNYTFSLEFLSNKINLEPPVVSDLLSLFSCAWGELEAYETDYIYLSNPVWLKPIIKLDNENYFCVIPQVFFSFIFPVMGGLIEKIDRDLLSKRRAVYLEEKIVEIINRRFPKSNTVSGIKWNIDNVEYETDLITFVDSHAIIVEAKSGKITDPALRGAPDSLREHIDEILISPNIQSKRLKEKLELLIDNPEMNDPLRDKLPVDLNDIHKIIRMSVSLEDFGAIQTNVDIYKKTGWLSCDFKSCPVMNLADFETLFDFLDHPVQIIHYIERRQELENERGFMGDELDLMGLYIDTLFNIGDIDKDINFMISEMSSPIDAYYNSRDAGIDIPKPKPKVSPLFSGIMDQLEKRKTPRWTEIGVILNRFSPDDQNRLAKMIIKLKKNVRKNWAVEGHKNMVIFSPPKASSYALCYVVYCNDNAEMRDQYIHEGIRYALEPEHVTKCLVIAKNMDDDDLSYHFIALSE